MKVTLTRGELALAKAVGTKRQKSAEAHARKNAHGHSADTTKGTWDHILGATGECAVAKALNIFWFQPDFADRNLGDVGIGLHVRSTDRLDNSLIVHERDPDEGAFILAIQDLRVPGMWEVVGWIIAREAKIDEWWETKTKRPAFFVPQWGLNPMETLVAWIDERRGEYV